MKWFTCVPLLIFWKSPWKLCFQIAVAGQQEESRQSTLIFSLTWPRGFLLSTAQIKELTSKKNNYLILIQTTCRHPKIIWNYRMSAFWKLISGGRGSLPSDENKSPTPLSLQNSPQTENGRLHTESLHKAEGGCTQNVFTNRGRIHTKRMQKQWETARRKYPQSKLAVHTKIIQTHRKVAHRKYPEGALLHTVMQLPLSCLDTQNLISIN